GRPHTGAGPRHVRGAAARLAAWPGQHISRSVAKGTELMTQAARPTGELNWLLDDLVNQVTHIRHAIVLSGDGLPVGASHLLTREDRERFAAIASGFHSLAKGTGQHFDAGSVVQTLVELEHGFLFVVAAGDRSCLAVFCDAG